MADKLTIKQEKFCQGLFSGLTQREAYKQAFDCGKMMNETIDKRACELAKLGKVKGRLKELTNKLASRNMVTVERVLAEYAKIGFADIKDFLSFRTAQTVVEHDKETGEPIIDFQQVIEMKDSDEVDGTMIQEVSISPKGVFSFKLHDKKGALDMMGKTLGMFTDKLEVNGNMVIFKGEKDLED